MSLALLLLTLPGIDEHSPSFRREILPALTQAGCNQGACHGAPQGRGSFKLSPRGRDPESDYQALTRDSFGRRIHPQSPERSLLLRKGMGLIPHGGEAALPRGSHAARVVQDWIARGAPCDSTRLPPLTRLDATSADNQIRVLAQFADGEQRDVTKLTSYACSDPETARVDFNGHVRFLKSGEVVVVARYLEGWTTTKLLHVITNPKFVWPDVRANNFVDHHVFAKLRHLQLPPAELCTEGQFIRRVSLDLCGRLPTPDQYRTYLADPDPDRRRKWIDRLLGEADFLDYWALQWLDLLGTRAHLLRPQDGEQFRQWFRLHLAQTTSFDAVVRELLTAGGSTAESAPANFLRLGRLPHEIPDQVAETFLGVRLGCARCHDHPHSRWTVEDHAGFAAFFARVQVKVTPGRGGKPEPAQIVILPEGQATPPVSGKAVAPRFLGGETPLIGPGKDRREVLARWLTRRDNPYFAQTIVNTVWARLLGRGIVEEPDNFHEGNPPVNEELLQALTQDFVAHDFDLKHLIRTIVLSRTYQAGKEPHPLSKDDKRYFAWAYPRRLNDAQLLDALSIVTQVGEVYKDRPAGTRAIHLLPGTDQPFLRTLSQPARDRLCECDPEKKTPLHVMALLGHDQMMKKIQVPNNRLGDLLARKVPPRELMDELFLAAMSRLPTPQESLQAEVHLEMHRYSRTGWEDILWALLNTKEFQFR